ncbi:nuclear receptor subfamily 2 group E member 1-like [Prorops nasuta]|uniref:nuclear receptor subfamily 2 group E member 1-like n=1 Tax=Prorops nasuta TaxID=863751 RepID=UPI0034CEF3FE
MEESNRNETVCKVCGDKASGKHYGVPSCDGCRGFFKRSIRRYARNLDYVCKENGRCIVDVSRRNQCQACRFTKCLQVNMKRDAVQHERSPRNPATIAAAGRRGPTNIYPGIPHIFPAGGNPYYPLLCPSFFPFKPPMPAFAPAVGPFMPRPSMESLTASTGKEDEVSSSQEIQSAEKRLKAGADESVDTRRAPPIIASLPTEYMLPSLSLLSAENTYEFAAKLLFFAVRWAKSIHSFLQLPFRDQTILLEESWSELFILTAAQWNFPVDESTLIPRDLPAERSEALNDEVRKLRELLNKCTQLRVDYSEYACLKTIVLFKGEARGLSDAETVSALQEQTVAVFCEREARRVGRLLLLLPSARALCRSTLQELLFKPTVGDVSIERLLGDMVGVLRPH